MNDQNDTTRRRVDGLLRQWGATEAASQAADELSAPVASKPIPQRRRGNLLLRWAPVGIAALLLLAAGVMFISSLHAPQFSVARNRMSEAAPLTPKTQPVDLSAELAIARQDAIEARKQAGEARTALSELLMQKQVDDIQITDLRTRLKTQSGQIAQDRQDWAFMETKLDSLLSQAEQSARQAGDELKKVKKDLAIAQTAATKTPKETEEIKNLKTRLAVAVSELKRQRTTFRDANIERDKARQALASLKASQDNTIGQVRRVYLDAAAPGKTGFEALQEAMKQRGLLRRCVVLQRKARTEADKKLLARSEVVLTRLGLLDLTDPTAVSAYIVQLGKSDLIASLDAAGGAMLADAETQDWLFETKLILTGVQRVT